MMMNDPKCHPSTRSNLSPINPLAQPAQQEGEGHGAIERLSSLDQYTPLSGVVSRFSTAPPLAPS
jgi:hypothetical protein